MRAIKCSRKVTFRKKVLPRFKREPLTANMTAKTRSRDFLRLQFAVSHNKLGPLGVN